MSNPEEGPVTGETALQPEVANPAQNPETPESDAEWRVRIEAELAQHSLILGSILAEQRGESAESVMTDGSQPEPTGQSAAEAQTPAEVPPAETGQTAPPADVGPRDTHPWFNRVGS